ncbi:MAG: hypothetical protein KAH95_00895 [Spirochaetales bacterium]|nr:hypothetical protein [Spirochaetales bacterium]
MKKILVIVLVVASIFTYTSCQQIFTYSALEWAQRDPADLPPEQQISYAESILSSGDTEAMADAYAVIDDLLADDPNNVDLILLAADLAIGGSGITDAIANLDLENLDTSVETILASLDLALVAASAEHVEAAFLLDPTAVSEEQYLNTGLILLADAANEAGSFTALDSIIATDLPEWDILLQANEFILRGGGVILNYGVDNVLLPLTI